MAALASAKTKFEEGNRDVPALSAASVVLSRGQDALWGRSARSAMRGEAKRCAPPGPRGQGR